MTRRRAFWALSATIVVAVTVATSASVAQSDLDQARVAVEALQDEIDEYLEQLIIAQSHADDAAVRYWEADLALYELNADIAEMSERMVVLDSRVAELRAQLIEIAVQRYIDSTTPPSILAGDDINRQSALDALARFVSEGSLDIIDDYRRARDDLDQAQATLAERARHQQELIAQAAAAAAEAQEALSAIGDTYLQIAPRLYEQDRLLDALEAEERRRLEAELRRRQAEEARRLEAARAAAAAVAAEEAARAAAAAAEAASLAAAAAAAEESSGDGPPPVVPGQPTATELPVLAAPDGWVCPLSGPFSHFDDFGDPRHYGGWHKGNDLIAPTGTPVLAVESGRLEHRANRIGGNSAYVHADSGNYYYFTHLSAYENVGVPWVAAGTVIGYVGDSGNAAGLPHLHFEYHLGGRGNHINPYPIVHEACF